MSDFDNSTFNPDCEYGGVYFLTTENPSGCQVVEVRSDDLGTGFRPCGMPPFARFYFGLTTRKGRDLEPVLCWRHLHLLGDTGHANPVRPAGGVA